MSRTKKKFYCCDLKTAAAAIIKEEFALVQFYSYFLFPVTRIYTFLKKTVHKTALSTTPRA